VNDSRPRAEARVLKDTRLMETFEADRTIDAPRAPRRDDRPPEVGARGTPGLDGLAAGAGADPGHAPRVHEVLVAPQAG